MKNSDSVLYRLHGYPWFGKRTHGFEVVVSEKMAESLEDFDFVKVVLDKMIPFNGGRTSRPIKLVVFFETKQNEEKGPSFRVQVNVVCEGKITPRNREEILRSEGLYEILINPDTDQKSTLKVRKIFPSLHRERKERTVSVSRR